MANPNPERVYNARNVAEYSTITNYASTIRTNADMSQKGLQTTAFVQDGAGVPTAYSSNLLQFNGDGRYVDTKWIPSASEDWTIELVSESIIPIGVSSYEVCGVEASTNIVIIGTYSSNGIDRRRIIKVGDKLNVDLLSVTEGAYVHLCVVYNSLSSTYIVYENNSASTPQSITTFTSGSTQSIVIGAKNSNGTITDKSRQPKGTFLLHKGKALSATEIATAYAQAKLIYPTLP